MRWKSFEFAENYHNNVTFFCTPHQSAALPASPQGEALACANRKSNRKFATAQYKMPPPDCSRGGKINRGSTLIYNFTLGLPCTPGRTFTHAPPQPLPADDSCSLRHCSCVTLPIQHAIRFYYITKTQRLCQGKITAVSAYRRSLTIL